MDLSKRERQFLAFVLIVIPTVFVFVAIWAHS